MNRIADALGRAEAWLDARGRWAWIAAMVIGFIIFWPIGLALLAFMIWSGRMNCGNTHRRSRHKRLDAGPTGNAAFDEYRDETLRRLEEEQTAFKSFLDQLRRAKDKAEFDQFMAERGRGAGEAQTT